MAQVGGSSPSPIVMFGNYKIRVGNCLTELTKLKSGRFHCAVTSPPYFGLRDYGTGKWEGGDSKCDHKEYAPKRGKSTLTSAGVGQTDQACAVLAQHRQYAKVCKKCGAQRVDDQIGLEESPEQYVAKLVTVFREIRRVLREDGTFWLNIGDTYAAGSHTPGGPKQQSNVGSYEGFEGQKYRKPPKGLKPKDLIGIPWRVALALQADGWYLRADIIWHKRTPMPSSVRDRPTTAHEYLFLFAKSSRYFYDSVAVQERAVSGPGTKAGYAGYSERAEAMGRIASGNEKPGMVVMNAATRNRRSVWTLSNYNYKEAHFATYPPLLVKPCILAGTSERGCCPDCGAPMIRLTKRIVAHTRKAEGGKQADYTKDTGANSALRDGHEEVVRSTVGWKSGCDCGNKETVPCRVIDPFNGSGTTGAVACQLGRDYVGIELNPKYAAMAERRISIAIKRTAPRKPGEKRKGLFSDLPDNDSPAKE